MTGPFDPRHFGKTARNEQRKLVATTLNTSGVAVLGIGVLTPLFSIAGFHASPMKIAVTSAIFVVLHMFAQRVLRDMEE